MLDKVVSHPIIFKSNMVRAILAGHKWQTRRVGSLYKKWQPGDQLWVKEPFSYVDALLKVGDIKVRYEADGSEHWIRWAVTTIPQKMPSIFMPRVASRLTLEINAIRTEHLQDITEEDAEAEGMPHPSQFREPLDIYVDGVFREATCYRDVFISAWNALQRERGYSWQSNPLVWVIQFKVMRHD